MLDFPEIGGVCFQTVDDKAGMLKLHYIQKLNESKNKLHSKITSTVL